MVDHCSVDITLDDELASERGEMEGREKKKKEEPTRRHAITDSLVFLNLGS